jgi:hypothetical protein
MARTYVAFVQDCYSIDLSAIGGAKDDRLGPAGPPMQAIVINLLLMAPPAVQRRGATSLKWWTRIAGVS